MIKGETERKGNKRKRLGKETGILRRISGREDKVREIARKDERMNR